MNELVTFLASAVVISLSGVLAPGALTAATIAAGARRRWAGTMVAVGHGIVELPLIVLIVAGMAVLFQRPEVKVGIGIAGGLFMLWMANGLRRAAGQAGPADQPPAVASRGALWTGVILSASNPYFLAWWATTGLKLAMDARSLGWLAFVLFAVIHWLLDLIWLTLLSHASFRGNRLMGGRCQQVVWGICALGLLYFALKFLGDASVGIYRLTVLGQ